MLHKKDFIFVHKSQRHFIIAEEAQQQAAGAENSEISSSTTNTKPRKKNKNRRTNLSYGDLLLLPMLHAPHNCPNSTTNW